MNGYRRSLRGVLGAAAVPYGYTVLTAGSGGVLIRRHGAPTVAAALMFIAGAGLANVVASLLAGSREDVGEVRQTVDQRWIAVASALAAIAGLALAAPVATGVHGSMAFGLVAFVATTAYLLVGAAGFTLLARHEGSSEPGPDASGSTTTTEGV